MRRPLDAKAALAYVAVMFFGVLFVGSAVIAGWEVLHGQPVNAIVQQNLDYGKFLLGTALGLTVGVGLTNSDTAALVKAQAASVQADEAQHAAHIGQAPPA